jgi:putative redox protein
MRSTRISFPTSDDVLLSGSLDLPEGKPRAHALFANCFSCSSQSHAARRIGQALALRFDFTGLGASDGAFADSHFVANIEDLKAAVRATAGPIR